ncbi:MAG: type VI secretion system baseplate subunit TssK [Planctomycetaceae bacterium]
MRTRQVAWQEGMMVLPHHFQSAELNQRDWLATSSSWLNQYAYGIRTLDLNYAALENFEVRIPRLEARLKDGTLVSVPDNATLETLDVRAAFEGHQQLYVFLRLPNVVPGRPNAQKLNGHRSEVVRYLTTRETLEEMNSGGNSREIETQQLNVHLSAQPTLEAPGGFESLPLFRLRRSLQPGAVPELDTQFIPPVLAVNAFPALQQNLLLAVCSQLGSFIKTQAQSLKTLGGWQESTQPQVQRSILQLHTVNSVYPLLVQLFQSQGLHPFKAFTELCRTVGQLSIFRPDWEPPTLPGYDHDNLYDVFNAVKLEIESIFQSNGVSSQVLRFPFVPTATCLEVGVEEDWLGEGYEFFIGIQSDLPAADLERLFAEKHLDWKLGSGHSIDQIYQNGESGLGIQRVERQSTLPTLKSMTYFRIENTGPYWQQLAMSRSLAVKVNDRFLHDTTTPERTITVVDEAGNLNSLGLDLFVLKHE